MHYDYVDEMFKVMVTGKDPSGEWDISKLREGFKFDVHGDDRQGRWDIGFSNMFDAIEWHRMWRDEIAEFTIRENDTVTDLNHSVVMTMTPKNKF